MFSIMSNNNLNKLSYYMNLNIGREVMPMEKNFMTVEEVAEELKVSKFYAYKVVRELNAEMRERGYLTISGRVNTKPKVLRGKLLWHGKTSIKKTFLRQEKGQ